ncbi:RapZ C-terminal domain-containing protein [Desulfopila aestuarii]|nr:RNase adapter RapZ [Desulfopila aestuarii]
MKTQNGPEQFEVELFSFGFKYGTPEDANLVFDVRFLPNPYWEEGMRHLTGRDGAVADYVLTSVKGKEFLAYLAPLLRFLIKANREAGKAGLRIGIGCTGGHHRSVAVVEQLGQLLADDSFVLRFFHRDIDKE